MATTTAPDLAAEVAELRRRLDRLTSRRKPGRRSLAIAGVAVLALAALAGVAGASGSTTNVAFVTLTPAKTVLSNASIPAHKTSSPIVIGGSSTVPSDATTVALQVTAKGAAGGVLNFYPAGNPGGGSGEAVFYPSGNGPVTESLAENVGMSGEVTISNSSSGAATVTVKIVGYSTQVTAADISPSDGTNGQVLTNTGVGASWQTLPKVDAGGIDGTGGAAGTFLANDGSGGASWQPIPNVGVTYSAGGFLSNNQTLPSSGAEVVVESINVPAGVYLVNAVAMAKILNTTSDTIACFLTGTPSKRADDAYTSLSTSQPTSSMSLVAVISTPVAETITESCVSAIVPGSSVEINSSSLVATQEGSANGQVYH